MAQSVERLGYAVLGFDSRQRMGILLFTTVSRPTLGSTQPPIQWVPGALSLVVKRPVREGDYLSPSSAEIKNAIHPLTQYVFMARCLVKQRDKYDDFSDYQPRQMVER
jgi:hypothetical protein